MTFFFFIVGLEVTSEFTIGELTDRARAAVPVIAAIAGWLCPPSSSCCSTRPETDARAWGVVISTDTAFLVGALAIIGPNYPARLRIFLLTLAVVDDVGALGVIALFYSEHIRIVPLVVAAAAHRRDRAGAVAAGVPAAPPIRCWGSRCGWRCSWAV